MTISRNTSQELGTTAHEQRGHLSAHALEGQCVEYANCEILAKLKIELSVNITKYQLI